MDKIELKATKGYVKIFINSIIHLSFRRDELYGIKSFIDGHSCKKYMIEIYLQKGMMICEYDKRGLWMEILELLDSIFE